MTKQDEKLINAFREQMIKELKDNAHKGRWEHLDPLYLIGELHYHVSKLYVSLNHNEKDKIKEHSADCANIAMMIFGNFGKE